jgi:hypothetical protein
MERIQQHKENSAPQLPHFLFEHVMNNQQLNGTHIQGHEMQQTGQLLTK